MRISVFGTIVATLAISFSQTQGTAAVPSWWTGTNTRIIQDGGTADNYAPANIGQLKHVAKQAKKHLDASLVGGAGTAINQMVAGFTTGTTPEQISANYAPLNIGQLKFVAKPFYDRLREAGYDTKTNLIARGYPSGWNEDYPWDPDDQSNQLSNNYAPANLGQLKLVFSFDVQGLDADEDGLPDWWEDLVAGVDPYDAIEDAGDVSPTGNLDGDSLNNLEEWQLGLDPLNPSDAPGYLVVMSGDDQTVPAANHTSLASLVVRAVDYLNRPMAAAPIKVRVSSGDASIRKTGSVEGWKTGFSENTFAKYGVRVQKTNIDTDREPDEMNAWRERRGLNMKERGII